MFSTIHYWRRSGTWNGASVRFQSISHRLRPPHEKPSGLTMDHLPSQKKRSKRDFTAKKIWSNPPPFADQHNFSPRHEHLLTATVALLTSIPKRSIKQITPIFCALQLTVTQGSDGSWTPSLCLSWFMKTVPDILPFTSPPCAHINTAKSHQRMTFPSAS